MYRQASNVIKDMMKVSEKAAFGKAVCRCPISVRAEWTLVVRAAGRGRGRGVHVQLMLRVAAATLRAPSSTREPHATLHAPLHAPPNAPLLSGVTLIVSGAVSNFGSYK